ncbi:HTH domain-containing protein [Halomonas sp. MCCC 1A17488]|uniref:HTH domain-containing protein n=1 Tax=unclassified Halomonas TaxID=2609666 RepID=UPI0018D26A85|nr:MULTISPECIES: HTH domain-containing protein [unclassified Halomonas]MCE8015265.1 HTH domain-containing protein [Halomonas sp. MCCC 1A17488]MCG3238598.1 HTH domain-containing protein [Halomonas sp. MCCC 1A17488]QPP51424.1 HTH domain-containing protein [Halomonas sp. SS10-MC5]
MSRTTRLLELMQVLRRHRRPVSGNALARELGVSLRTLYRDIASLRAIGAEIDGEPGMGYLLRPGLMLPPLMFTEEELEALALGLRWVGRRADDGLSLAAGDALAKLTAVLPGELRHRMQDSALWVGPGWERPQVVDLETLRRAIRRERKLHIDYRDQQGKRSSRLIWPFAIAFFESTRLVVGWCELRQAFRSFRTDRIEAASPLEERYPRARAVLEREWLDSLLPESVSVESYAGATSNRREECHMQHDIVFYTNPLSRAGIVHWMLEEIGQPYRMEVLEFGAPMKSPTYLAVNPMGKVPAIRHGDTVVTEAAAICAYLAETFPEAGLLPAAEARGDYYRWLFFAAGPVEMALSLKHAGFSLTAEHEMQFGCGSYEAVVETLAKAVAGRRYIAGDTFTAADVYVGSHIGWGMQFGTLERRPEFEAYWAGLRDRPANRRSEAYIAEAMQAQAAAGSAQPTS